MLIDLSFTQSYSGSPFKLSSLVRHLSRGSLAIIFRRYAADRLVSEGVIAAGLARVLHSWQATLNRSFVVATVRAELASKGLA